MKKYLKFLTSTVIAVILAFLISSNAIAVSNYTTKSNNTNITINTNNIYGKTEKPSEGNVSLISNENLATSDYTIESYDINMVVNENNTFDIAERIIVNSNAPKHGICRKIPLINEVVREDGSKSRHEAQISNVSVNTNYTEKDENGYKVLQIEDSNKTVKSYVIKYTYDIGKDSLKNRDELYYNLIGSEWDTDISNIRFRIDMPKEFDKSKLRFSSGKSGIVGSSAVTYSVYDNVNGKSIEGKVDTVLHAGDALTVRLELPEGYFVGAHEFGDNGVETNEVITNEIENNEVEANNDEVFKYDKVNYIIEGYDIDMVVNENNTFDITEKITAYFNVPQHGIEREIPLINEVVREDGSKSRNRAKISNVNVVDEDYIESDSSVYKKLMIGNTETKAKGRQIYVIKYTYDIGKDPLKNKDELYYNLVGSEWDTDINNISFKITMPKEFDESKLGFSSGEVGTVGNSAVSYSVNGNEITGTFDSVIHAGEALTVRLELPEGYFVGARTNTDWASIGIIALCIVIVLYAYKTWYKYGKDDEIVETVEFYPPEGYNSAEIGFLYKGEVGSSDVVSLLIYLANKGYLKIEEIKTESSLSSSEGFKITKLKEYNGNNEAERIFFNGLFKKGDSVTNLDLYDNFYTTVDEVAKKINSKENKDKIFERKALNKIIWLIVISVIIYILTIIKANFEYKDSFEFPFWIVSGLILLPICIITKNKVLKIILSMQLFVYMGGSLLVESMFIVAEFMVTGDRLKIVAYLIEIIAIIVLFVFAKLMRKRTEYGNMILGRIKGFKRFLETAEKGNLEALVNQNPEYFYDILPYTYVLGVSDVWMNKFETIAMQSPDWYYSSTAFDFHVFKTTMDTAQATIISYPSSSSSGGSFRGGSSGGRSSGGGGFSGRGSGGGGGRSW